MLDLRSLSEFSVPSNAFTGISWRFSTMRTTRSTPQSNSLCGTPDRSFRVAAINSRVVVTCASAWEAYIEELVRESLIALRPPEPPLGLWPALNATVRGQLGRFNTPNTDNIRMLISDALGLQDVQTFWSWRGCGSALAVQRLARAMTLRHEIAHGVNPRPVCSHLVCKGTPGVLPPPGPLYGSCGPRAFRDCAWHRQPLAGVTTDAVVRQGIRNDAMKTVYIAGRSGTSGLVLHELVRQRDDLRLLSPEVQGRNALARDTDLLNAADVVILCLRSPAVKETLERITNPDVKVIDLSTTHSVADGWVYGLPELHPEQRTRSARHAGSAVLVASRRVRSWLSGHWWRGEFLTPARRFVFRASADIAPAESG